MAVCVAMASPLVLTSCGGEDKAQFSPTGGGNAGTSVGGAGVNGGSPGSAGTDGVGGGGSGNGGSATAGAGGADGGGAGGGGKAGGGTGGASGASGNGGTGGNPPVRVYTIEGCDDAGVGGAGGASGAGGAGDGGAGGAGGASEAGGAGGAGGEGVGGEGGAAGPGPSPNFSATFSVFDFVTDDAIPTCADKASDFSITITGDAPLTVVTDIAGVTPASVIWTYDGVAQGVHNLAPYSLGPDDAGDYEEPDPPLAPGVHTLTITAYDAMDGMGNVLGTATITLTVVDGDA